MAGRKVSERIRVFNEQWQQIYNQYKQGDYNGIFNDNNTVTGLIVNSCMQYGIPMSLQPDFKQHIRIAIWTALTKYDPTKNDKLLPYVIRGIQIAAMDFLNKEIYGGTIQSKNQTNIYASTSSLSAAESIEGDINNDTIFIREDNERKNNTLNTFKNWLKGLMSDVEWEIYCYQWGVWGHEKLKADKIAERLNMPVTDVKRIKVNISVRMWGRMQRIKSGSIPKELLNLH